MTSYGLRVCAPVLLVSSALKEWRSARIDVAGAMRICSWASERNLWSEISIFNLAVTWSSQENPRERGPTVAGPSVSSGDFVFGDYYSLDTGYLGREEGRCNFQSLLGELDGFSRLRVVAATTMIGLRHNVIGIYA